LIIIAVRFRRVVLVCNMEGPENRDSFRYSLNVAVYCAGRKMFHPDIVSNSSIRITAKPLWMLAFWWTVNGSLNPVHATRKHQTRGLLFLKHLEVFPKALASFIARRERIYQLLHNGTWQGKQDFVQRSGSYSRDHPSVNRFTVSQATILFPVSLENRLFPKVFAANSVQSKHRKNL